MSSIVRHLVPLKGSLRIWSFGSSSRESILSVNKGIISLNPRVNLLLRSNVSPFKNKFLYLSSIAFLMFQPERNTKNDSNKSERCKMSYIDIISETQISISDNIHFPWFYFFTFIIFFSRVGKFHIFFTESLLLLRDVMFMWTKSKMYIFSFSGLFSKIKNLTNKT